MEIIYGDPPYIIAKINFHQTTIYYSENNFHQIQYLRNFSHYSYANYEKKPFTSNNYNNTCIIMYLIYK